MDGKSNLTVVDLGDSERLLSQKHYLRKTIQSLQQRGIIPVENGWAGWLGRYERNLVQTGVQMEEERANRMSKARLGR